MTVEEIMHHLSNADPKAKVYIGIELNRSDNREVWGIEEIKSSSLTKPGVYILADD